MANALTKTFTLTTETRTARAGRIAAIVGVAGAIALVAALIAIVQPGDYAPLFFSSGITAFTALFVPLLLVLRRVALRVHADGLALREGVGRVVFLPYDTVASVSTDGPAVVLVLRDGRVMRYDVTPDGRVLTASKNRRCERARSIASEIADALRAHRAAPDVDPAHPLERGGRTAADWLRSLRGIGKGGVPTFRNAPAPTRDELLAIATSSRAAPTHRVAAAVALQAGLTAEERPRIRVAAESSGAPQLGERLVRVVEASSNEQLEEVLEEETVRLVPPVA